MAQKPSCTIEITETQPSWRGSVGRASAWSYTVREWQHDRSWFQAPPMPAHRYVEENGLATINRSAGVVPEVNLRECVTCMPWPSTNKVAHSGFETQKRRQQKSKTVASVALQKMAQIFF